MTARESSRASSLVVSASLVACCVAPRIALASDGSAEPGAGLTDLLSSSSGLASSLRLILLLTVFGAVPTIVLLATCYPRLVIVLAFLRRALGTQDLPPHQVVAGLALIMTALVMAPVWQRVYDDAYLPLSRGEIETPEEAFQRAADPLKEFMLVHTFRKDLYLFADLARKTAERSENSGALGSQVPVQPRSSFEQTPVEDLSFFIVLPAFVLSELKTAFQIGFLLYLPFLVIDLAVSAILLSMGMFMMPPVLVSLPLKIMVFVMVDGWNLVVGQLIAGFHPV